MKPKHARLGWVIGSIVVMAIAGTLILRTFQDSLVFFFTPTQFEQKRNELAGKREIRIGGLVKTGSVKNTKGGIRFTITDFTTEMAVAYRGLLPTLFREGQGVVAQGAMGEDGIFTASTILAKHDENYMPREVVEQLKATGHWQDYGPRK